MEDKKIDAFEKRRQRESSRKYDKQVSDIRKQEKAQHVKQEIDTVTRVRKSGKEAGAEGKQELEKVLNSRGMPTKSKKRLGMVRCCALCG